MKKLPTALAVPRINFRLWLKMAPPLAAIVPALGSACGVGGAAAASSDGDDTVPKSKKLVSMPFRSRKPLTLTSCDLSVLLSAVVCWAIVVPPRKTMPDSMPATTRHTAVSRSAWGSRTTRPSKLLMALSATPSSMPENIRNSVAAKCQVNASSAANSTTPMPPTDIAHARSLRA
jgi:hypothetical protein